MSNYKVQRLTQLFKDKGDLEAAEAELQKDLMMLDAYVPELKIGVSTESVEKTAVSPSNSVRITLFNFNIVADRIISKR